MLANILLSLLLLRDVLGMPTLRQLQGLLADACSLLQHPLNCAMAAKGRQLVHLLQQRVEAALAIPTYVSTSPNTKCMHAAASPC
jgi:hypothetical protein